MSPERAEQVDFYIFVIVLVVVGVSSLFFLANLIFDHQAKTRALHEETVQACIKEGGIWQPLGQASGGQCLIGVEPK